MEQLTKPAGKNTGGICTVELAYTSDLSSMEKDYSQLAASPVFSDGGFREIYATPETVNLIEEQVETDAGTRYDYTLVVRLPKDRASLALSLFNLRYRNFIIRITNKNQLTRLLGTDLIPMRMAQQMLWPHQVSGYNGYELRFTGRFPHPPFFEGPSSGSGSGS